jgi:predicted RNase H-like nuclease (RuvC/YqgF family)
MRGARIAKLERGLQEHQKNREQLERDYSGTEWTQNKKGHGGVL